MRVDPIAKHGDERPALVMQQSLHLPDGAFAPSPRPSRGSLASPSSFSNRSFFPVRFIQGRVGSIRVPQNVRRRRAPAPIALDERTLEPDLVPKAVGRLLLSRSILRPALVALAWKSALRLDGSRRTRRRRPAAPTVGSSPERLRMEGGAVQIALALRPGPCWNRDRSPRSGGRCRAQPVAARTRP